MIYCSRTNINRKTLTPLTGRDSFLPCLLNRWLGPLEYVGISK